jgi:hypothetical protein
MPQGGRIVAKTAEELAQLEAEIRARAAIRAWHGSPWQFDEFRLDPDAAATGSGGMAQGWGVYLAENPEVAKTYDPRSARPGGLPKARHGALYEVAARVDKSRLLDWDNAFHQQPANVQQAIRQLLGRTRVIDSAGAEFVDGPHTGAPAFYVQSLLADGTPGRLWWESAAPTPEAAQREFDLLLEHANGDQIYEWLREQAEYASGIPVDPVGGRWADDDVAWRADQWASEQLRDAGVPGIKYLDAGSRQSKQGTHNLVVFDPKTIDILKRYGIAGAIVGGGGLAATSSDAEAAPRIPTGTARRLARALERGELATPASRAASFNNTIRTLSPVGLERELERVGAKLAAGATDYDQAYHRQLQAEVGWRKQNPGRLRADDEPIPTLPQGPSTVQAATAGGLGAASTWPGQQPPPDDRVPDFRTTAVAQAESGPGTRVPALGRASLDFSALEQRIRELARLGTAALVEGARGFVDDNVLGITAATKGAQWIGRQFERPPEVEKGIELAKAARPEVPQLGGALGPVLAAPLHLQRGLSTLALDTLGDTLTPGGAMLNMPGPELGVPSTAAMAFWKMSPFQKIRMWAAGKLATGHTLDEIGPELYRYGTRHGVTGERVASQIKAAMDDVDEIRRVTGGLAMDVDRAIRYYQQGISNRGWYDEMVPWVRQHLPRGNKAIYNPHAAGGTGLTWEQDRFIRAYAAFGSNAGPRDNYLKAMKVKEHIEWAARTGRTPAHRDRLLASRYPWGMTVNVSEKTGRAAPEPGLPSLRNLLEEGEPLGDRKIESYYYNNAGEPRRGYLDKERIYPLTGDRHHFRFHGFPTETLDENGQVVYQQGRSTAVQSDWLGDGPLANSGYQVMEDVAIEVTKRLGLPRSDVPRVQAAIWQAWRAEYEFFRPDKKTGVVGKIGQQGYPITQQHTLQGILATDVPSDRAARKQVAKQATDIMQHPVTGGTVHPSRGDLLGQPYSAVAMFPERTVWVPPHYFAALPKDTKPTEWVGRARGVIERFARDNADLLRSGDLSIGMWRPTEQITLNDRVVPGGTVVLDVVATPSNANQNRQARLLGMVYGQMAVYDLGVLPSGAEVAIGPGGHALPATRHVYDRLADVRPDAQQRLGRALTRRGAVGDETYDANLRALEQELRRRASVTGRH